MKLFGSFGKGLARNYRDFQVCPVIKHMHTTTKIRAMCTSKGTSNQDNLVVAERPCWCSHRLPVCIIVQGYSIDWDLHMALQHMGTLRKLQHFPSSQQSEYFCFAHFCHSCHSEYDAPAYRPVYLMTRKSRTSSHGLFAARVNLLYGGSHPAFLIRLSKVSS